MLLVSMIGGYTVPQGSPLFAVWKLHETPLGANCDVVIKCVPSFAILVLIHYGGNFEAGETRVYIVAQSRFIESLHPPGLTLLYGSKPPLPDCRCDQANRSGSLRAAFHRQCGVRPEA